jgi:hypothetical protein
MLTQGVEGRVLFGDFGLQCAGDGVAALYTHGGVRNTWRGSKHMEGFELWDAPTTVADFTDEDAIRNRYYAEAAELAKCSTGADHAYIFDHQTRLVRRGGPT